jgi:hypothetical protein
MDDQSQSEPKKKQEDSCCRTRRDLRFKYVLDLLTEKHDTGLVGDVTLNADLPAAIKEINSHIQDAKANCECRKGQDCCLLDS